MVRFIAECLLQKVRKVQIDTSEPLSKANKKQLLSDANPMYQKFNVA